MKRRRPFTPFKRFILIGSLGMLLATGAPVARPAAAGAFIPSQFVAKLYTEAMGVAPDQNAWSSWTNFFDQNGCDLGTLAAMGRAVYTSNWYLELPYDNASRVLTLFRGLLSREPAQADQDAWTAELDGGASWNDVVEAFIATDWFADLVPTICSQRNYFYGTTPAPNLPTTGPPEAFHGGTGEQLQAVIDATPVGGTVWLAQKAVVRASEPVIVRAGRTIQTVNLANGFPYAAMGRIVRVEPFDSSGSPATVIVESGGRLITTWVDGQRGVPTNFTPFAFNVHVLGGNNTAVIDSRSSNPRGHGNIVVSGQRENPAYACSNVSISQNVVTNYSTSHNAVPGITPWSDGITIACGSTTVQRNHVVDASDVAIITFPDNPGIQASQVSLNRVVNAGNSAFAAMAANGETGGGTHGFQGNVFDSNEMWAGPGVHFDLGISVGTRAWFGTNVAVADGPRFTDNTIPFTTVVQSGIAVSGAINAIVGGNEFALAAIGPGNCPKANIGVDPDDGWPPSGVLQGPFEVVRYTEADGTGCIQAH